jgi:hypothetical protein
MQQWKHQIAKVEEAASIEEMRAEEDMNEPIHDLQEILEGLESSQESPSFTRPEFEEKVRSKAAYAKSLGTNLVALIFLASHRHIIHANP